MDSLVTVKELAKILNVAPSWIYQRTQLGPKAIPFVKLGHQLRFDSDEVINFFREKGGLPPRIPSEAPNRDGDGKQKEGRQPGVILRAEPEGHQTLEAVEDGIVDLVAEALYNHLTRRGLAKEKITSQR